MNVDVLQRLSAGWREDAEVLRRCGAAELADREEARADDLDDAIREWLDEALTLREAAAESGLAYSTLQGRVSQGSLPNAGLPGAPRIRRRDLPYRGATPDAEEDSLTLQVLEGRI